MAKVRIKRVWTRDGIDQELIDSIFAQVLLWPSEKVRQGVITGRDKVYCERFNDFLDILANNGMASVNDFLVCMNPEKRTLEVTYAYGRCFGWDKMSKEYCYSDLGF